MEDPTPPSSADGTSQLWRLSDGRGRKVACPNIFQGVSLPQLQRLFQRSGDQDAERRARQVWGRGDEAELAQALTGPRGQRRRRRAKAGEARDCRGSRWLRAFGHLRIDEGPPGPAEGKSEDGSEAELSSAGGPEGSVAGQGDTPSADRPADSGPPQGGPPTWHRSRVLRQGGDRNPEHYLHRILH